MDVSLVTLLAILAVTISQTSEKYSYATFAKDSSIPLSSPANQDQSLLPLFPGAFNCCTKISDEIPKGILRRVERFEMQKADGLCHLEAVILYINDKKFCVSPRIRKLKKWMKKNKHKIPRRKPHSRKQRRTKIIKKKEKKQ